MPWFKNSETGVFISNRHMSWVIAALMTVSFLVFLTGYFLGQKKVLEQFSDKLEQDSLSDKIYSSLFALYDSKGVTNVEIAEGSSESDEDDQEASKLVKNDETTMEIETPVSVAQGSQAAPASQQNYCAQLVGFGAADSAYAFAKRLNKDATMVHVKKHTSKSAKGRVRTWYQVVTKPFDSRESLVAFVDQVIQREHLKDVRIIAS